MKGFLASMYVGLQIESNWTKRWVWLLYLAAYPIGSFLAVIILYGIFGLQATVAPDNGPLSAIGTFRIRYF